jgi:hypothetical protein
LYCSNLLDEYGLMGICSFGLTILNIILILITGAIVLKVKFRLSKFLILVCTLYT